MTRTLLTMLALAGPGGVRRRRDREDVATADSLSRDLQLAPVDTSAELNDQPGRRHGGGTGARARPGPSRGAEARGAQAHSAEAEPAAGAPGTCSRPAATPAPTPAPIARRGHLDHGHDGRGDPLQETSWVTKSPRPSAPT